jgi:hypothetical protein
MSASSLDRFEVHPFSSHPYLSDVPYVDTSSLFSLCDLNVIAQLTSYYENPVVVEIRSIRHNGTFGEPLRYAVHHLNPARLDDSWGVRLSSIDDEDTRRCTMAGLTEGFLPVKCMAQNALINGEKIEFVGRMHDLANPSMRDPCVIFRRQFRYLHEAERRIRQRGVA